MAQRQPSSEPSKRNVAFQYPATDRSPKLAAKKAAPTTSGAPKAAKMVKPGQKHPGFAALVKKGVPAGALANAARNASPAAKKANPNLKNVLPAKKKGK